MVQVPKLNFQPRGIYAGEYKELSVLHAVRITESECLVLLTEKSKQGFQYSAIHRAFELIATAIRQELRYLKRITLPIRFFHAREVPQGENSCGWEVQEVVGDLAHEQFIYAKWTAAPDELKSEFIAALSSSALLLKKNP